MHVIEKLRHDIRSFPLRMLRVRLLNAERWDLKTGELEEKVNLLRLRHAELEKRLRGDGNGCQKDEKGCGA
jgi:hypothetical protein